ncbi:hypothetical protein PYCC9005_002600 [Savitreella phatthalungensis]
MGRPGDLFLKVRAGVREDPTLAWIGRHTKTAAKELPYTIPGWLLDRVPVVRWLPRYKWRQWTIWDLVAGLTVGLMLVPQSIAYASVADLPVQYGLFAAYLPPIIYAVTGTSKDLTVGPTAVVSLLTAETIRSLPNQNAVTVALALAFMVGVYSLALGLLHLGIILDFFSGGVLSGYTSGAAVVIAVQQVPKILGQKHVSTQGKVGTIIHRILVNLGHCNGRDIAFSIGSFIALISLQKLGQKLGSGNTAPRKMIWFIGIARNTIVVIIFTAISYALNKDRRSHPLISIIGNVPKGLHKPAVPDLSLLSTLAGKAVTVFLAAVLEHMAIGKAFARRDGVELDFSQELVSLGLCNIISSFFGSFPVTGSFSRTAVNRQSGSKSPLSGLLCSVIVIISVEFVTPAFFWIPSSTLGVVIFLAVIQLIASPKVFYQLWRISFWDFVASQLALWLTIFYSVEVGILTAVGFSLVVMLWRIARPKVRTLGKLVGVDEESQTLATSRTEGIYADLDDVRSQPQRFDTIPGIMVLRLEESLVFSNHRFVANTIMNRIYANTSGNLTSSAQTFNSTLEERVMAARRRAGTIFESDHLPPLRALVLDFSAVNHLDSAGLQCLYDLRAHLSDYASVDAFELHFVCVHKSVLRIMELADIVNPIDRPERAPPAQTIAETTIIRKSQRSNSRASLSRTTSNKTGREWNNPDRPSATPLVEGVGLSVGLTNSLPDLSRAQHASCRASPGGESHEEGSSGMTKRRRTSVLRALRDRPILPRLLSNKGNSRRDEPASDSESATSNEGSGENDVSKRAVIHDRTRAFLDLSAEKFFVHLSIDRAIQVVEARLATRSQTTGAWSSATSTPLGSASDMGLAGKTPDDVSNRA